MLLLLLLWCMHAADNSAKGLAAIARRVERRVALLHREQAGRWWHLLLLLLLLLPLALVLQEHCLLRGCCGCCSLPGCCLVGL